MVFENKLGRIHSSASTSDTTSTEPKSSENETTPSDTNTTATANSKGNSNANVNNVPKTLKRQGETIYEIGDKVKFYDLQADEMTFGTIIKKVKGKAYKIGSKGRYIFMNIQNFAKVEESKENTSE